MVCVGKSWRGKVIKRKRSKILTNYVKPCAKKHYCTLSLIALWFFQTKYAPLPQKKKTFAWKSGLFYIFCVHILGDRKEVANWIHFCFCFFLPTTSKENERTKKKKSISERKRKELLTPNSTFQFQKDFQNFSGQFFLSFFPPEGVFFAVFFFFFNFLSETSHSTYQRRFSTSSSQW